MEVVFLLFRVGVATDRALMNMWFKAVEWLYFTGLNHVFLSALSVATPTQKRKITTSMSRSYTGLGIEKHVFCSGTT